MIKEHWLVQRFRELIGEGRRFASEYDMAMFLGLSKTNFSKLYNFLKGTETQYTTVFDWIEKLSVADEEGAVMPFMRRMGANAPEVAVEGDDLVTVPVVGVVGAGPGQFNYALEPIEHIPVLKNFIHPGLFVCQIEGDSMEPTILAGAYVGAIPPTRLREGAIYIFYDTVLGAVAKRLCYEGPGKLSLVSDNKAVPPISLDVRGYQNVLVGEVLWVWHKFKK